MLDAYWRRDLVRKQFIYQCGTVRIALFPVRWVDLIISLTKTKRGLTLFLLSSCFQIFFVRSELSNILIFFFLWRLCDSLITFWLLTLFVRSELLIGLLTRFVRKWHGVFIFHHEGVAVLKATLGSGVIKNFESRLSQFFLTLILHISFVFLLQRGLFFVHQDHSALFNFVTQESSVSVWLRLSHSFATRRWLFSQILTHRPSYLLHTLLRELSKFRGSSFHWFTWIFRNLSLKPLVF